MSENPASIPVKHLAEIEETFDQEQAFLLYANFCGDAVRTAHALGVSAVQVLKVADECGWNNKLAPILALMKSNRPGDVERGLNRAQNFVQARRMCIFLERVIQRVTNMNPQEFEEYLLTAAGKDGARVSALSCKPLADLATAMEKCQTLTYQALSDTPRDRAKREETGGDGASAGDLHAAIAKGMAAVRGDRSPRALLFDAQLQVGQAEAIQATKPADPYNKG